MAPFTALPVECVVNILLFLTPTDIRRCREISRPLRTAIRESRELQYLLELDALGYAVPLNPLPGLSLDSKIRILKEHHSKTGQLEISPISRVNVGVAPMGSNYQFSRGVFARGGPTLDTTRRLAIYQPASQNKQTKDAEYVLPDLGINAQSYRLDPDLDLLVLLEVDSNPIDPGTDLQMRFHLRSLATGLPHPLALVHTITGNFKFSSTYLEPAFQIVGRLLAISCHTSFRLDVSPPSLSIWDWTTGELVVSTDIAGRHFAFISEDTFIVPFDRRKWAGRDIVGSLEVYTISEGRASHVASLHLPTTPNRPCHSASQILFTPPAPSSGSPATTPPRIYEMGPKGHYTCLQLRAFNIKLMDSEMASGSLFIPSSTILDVLRAKVPSNPTDRSRVHIPWEDWSAGTTWVNNRHARGNRSCVFGHRVALLVFRQELKAWEVLVYDLRRGAKGEEISFGDMQRADEYLDCVFGEAGRPLIVASFLITPDVIPWDGRAGDNPPEIMLDDEHVFVFKEAPTNEESTIYVYTL